MPPCWGLCFHALYSRPGVPEPQGAAPARRAAPVPRRSPDHPGRQRQWPVVAWQPSAWLQSQRSAQLSPYVPSCVGDSSEDGKSDNGGKGATVGYFGDSTPLLSRTPLSSMHYNHLFPAFFVPKAQAPGGQCVKALSLS